MASESHWLLPFINLLDCLRRFREPLERCLDLPWLRALER
jgi:hypothetical protein